MEGGREASHEVKQVRARTDRRNTRRIWRSCLGNTIKDNGQRGQSDAGREKEALQFETSWQGNSRSLTGWRVGLSHLDCPP